MRKLLSGIVVILLSVSLVHAASGSSDSSKMITINDMVGRTITFSWNTGPFKNAAHLVTFVDPNTLTFSVQSGEKMSTPRKITYNSMQVSEKILLISWRSKEYGQTIVFTLDFENHMIFEVVVTKHTNYLSQGAFVVKE